MSIQNPVNQQVPWKFENGRKLAKAKRLIKLDNFNEKLRQKQSVLNENNYCTTTRAEDERICIILSEAALKELEPKIMDARYSKKVSLADKRSAGKRENPCKRVRSISYQSQPPDENILHAADINKTDDSASLSSAAITALGKINIDELFQKLVSSGILNNNITAATTINSTNAVQNINVTKPETTLETAKIEETSTETEEEKLPPIIPIDLRKSDSIKTRQEAIISTLYLGMQCSSCGVRFPPEQTIKYSQHLDWHFWQNLSDRDSKRIWFKDFNDFFQYVEFGAIFDAQLKSTDEDVIMQEDENVINLKITIEKDDMFMTDDDDDVIVLLNERPSVSEIDDDDVEFVPLSVTREEIKSVQKIDRESENKDESAMEPDVEIQEPNIPFTDLDTYEEKELPVLDENSQASFLNVKIKEEPKYDEDDGFEDVGTIMNGPHDEITIKSSEIQNQTVISSPPSPPLIVGGQHSVEEASVTQAIEVEEPPWKPDDREHILIDGNVKLADGYDLSSADPAPAVPLGSLINRIKINMAKNTPPTAASKETATTDGATANFNTKSFNINTSTNVVSTIPVLCAGGTIPTVKLANNISNISVIGSYGSYHKPQHHHHHQQSVPALTTPTTFNIVVNTSAATTTTATTTHHQRTPWPKVPAPVEEKITYEQKPALQKANLKKMKKFECGVEASGLCSIM